MKTRKIGASVLVAAIAAGLVVPVGASAASTPTEVADPYESKGSITYLEEDDGGTPGKTTDPEKGDDIDEPTPNPSTGKLMIISATDLVFTDQDGLDAGTPYGVNLTPTEEVYSAVPFAATDGTDTWTTPHFVEFRDARADAKYYTDRQYKITAQISTPFTRGTSGEMIRGAELDYKALGVQGQKNVVDTNTGLNTSSTYSMGTSGVDYTLASNLKLVQGADSSTAGAAVEVLKVHAGSANATANGTDGVGKGRYHITFGNNTDSTKVDENVQLRVPVGQSLSAGTYDATITWTITDTI